MHTQALRGTRAHTILEAIAVDYLCPPSLVDTRSVIVEMFFLQKEIQSNEIQLRILCHCGSTNFLGNTRRLTLCSKLPPKVQI